MSEFVHVGHQLLKFADLFLPLLKFYGRSLSESVQSCIFIADR